MEQKSQIEKTNIFVSYVTEEENLARILKKHIEEDFLRFVNLFTFSDIEGNPAGGRWLEALEKALDIAEIQLVLCSRKSVNSTWINFEAGAGWIKKIPVIPICHTGMDAGSLPLPFQSLVAVEANREEGLKKLYATIASYVRRKTDIGTPSKFREMLEQISTFEEEYKAKLDEDGKVDQRIQDIDVGLNRLSLGIAELELREKITVVNHRAMKFKEKPELIEKPYREDEIILLIGDSTAGIPLMEYAWDDTKSRYIDAIFNAMTSLDGEKVVEGTRFQKLLLSDLKRDLSNLSSNQRVNPQIAGDLKLLIKRCTEYLQAKGIDLNS